MVLPRPYNQYIRRLEVTVNDPILMQVVDPVQHLPDERLDGEFMGTLLLEMLAVVAYNLEAGKLKTAAMNDMTRLTSKRSCSA